MLILIILAIVALTIIAFVYGTKPKPKSKNIKEDNKVEVNQSNEVSKDLDDVLMEYIQAKVTLINEVKNNLKSLDDLQNDLFSFIKRKYYKYNFSDTDIEKSFIELKNSIWGYGPLQSLVDDKDISDIKIISPYNIRIKKLGKRMSSDIKFESDEKLKKYVETMASRNGIDLTKINAIRRFTDNSHDKFILRIDIASDYVNSVRNPYMHIRKIPKNKYLLNDLKNKGMFNNDIEKYLKVAMEYGLSLLICGKGGAGKTLLFNALIEEISHEKSGLIVQEIGELFSKIHPEIMFQHVVEAKGEDKIQYTLSDLIKNGLVSDNDYIGVGEIKGKEAWDLANASYTGHISIAAVHSMSAMEAPYKMVHYMKYSPNSRDMKEEDLMRLLLGFDCIIFLKDFKIAEIVEISEYKNGELKFNPIFELRKDEFTRLNESCEKIMAKLGR